MTKQVISICLLVLAACAATSESETRRWNNNQQDAGKMQINYPNMSAAIKKLQDDATAKFNEANTKTGNAQLQDMQQANKMIEQILYPIRDYERELKEAQTLMGQVPTAQTNLNIAINNAKNALAMVNNPDPNVAIGAFRAAYDQLKPLNDWAEEVKNGKNPPMPNIPGGVAMPLPPGTPGVGAPGAGTPGVGTPGVIPGTPAVVPPVGGPGENPGVVPGTPGGEAPGTGVTPPAGGPGGN